MKNFVKAMVVAGAILISGTTAVGSASATAGSEYEYLVKNGTRIEWYTVNKIEKGNKFTAIDPTGKKLVFNDKYTPNPESIKMWTRVRAYVNKGKVLTVEAVKPKLVEYKVTKITTNKTYSAKSKTAGGITIPKTKLEGKAPKVGDTVVVEFDTRFLDAGFIKAYKK